MGGQNNLQPCFTHSAGVVILLNNLQGKIIKVKTDSNGHWISVVLNINNVLFYLMCMVTIMFP